MSEKSKEQGARRPEAVAPEAASEAKTCADCGSTEVVVTTSDPAAEPRDYCRVHAPANVEIPDE